MESGENSQKPERNPRYIECWKAFLDGWREVSRLDLPAHLRTEVEADIQSYLANGNVSTNYATVYFEVGMQRAKEFEVV